jgi:hypothetical protein
LDIIGLFGSSVNAAISQVAKTGVAVEKLTLYKFAEISSR